MINLSLFFFTIFFFVEIVAPHTIYGKLLILPTLFLLFFVGIFDFNEYKIRLTKIKFNSFIVMYLVFLVYQCICACFNKNYDIDTTITYLKTGILCFLFLFATFIFFSNKSDLTTFKKIFSLIGIISVITVIYLCKDTLGEGRMAHVYKEGTSYIFLKAPVSISSNGLAMQWAISVFILLFSLLKDDWFKRIIKIIAIGILMLGIVLTGSRMGFLMLALLCFYWFVMFKKEHRIARLVLGVTLAIGAYVIVTQVEIFRSIIGERLEVLVEKFFNISDDLEESMQAREKFKLLGIDEFLKNPIFGHGIGWFNSVYGNVCENDYLETLVAGGVVGFIIYYSFIPLLIIKFIKSKHKQYSLDFFFVFCLMLIVMYGGVIMFTRDYLLYLLLAYLAINEANEKRCNICENSRDIYN